MDHTILFSGTVGFLYSILQRFGLNYLYDLIQKADVEQDFIAVDVFLQ